MNSSQGGIITRLNSLASQPFNEQGDLIQWVLFTILIATVAFAWTRILSHITES